MKKTKKYIALFLTALSLTAPLLSCQTKSELSGDETEAVQTQAHAERWIEIGEKAYLAGEIPDFDAAAFFLENTANIQYLSLYDDMYFYNRDIFESLSAHLYRFIHDEYGKEALTDTEQRALYKNAWMLSLDPSLSYPNNIRSEVLLSQMDCTSDGEFSYIVELDGVQYSFYDYERISPSLAHSVLFYNTTALSALKEELTEIDPEGILFDTAAPLSYVMSFDSSAAGMLPDGSYSVGKYEDMLVCAVSAMTKEDADGTWITEGLAEIYGKSKGLYYLTVYDRVFFLLPDTIEGYIEPLADAGEIQGIYHLAAAAYYYSAGGLIDQDADGSYVIDGKLYTHAAAYSDYQLGYQPVLDDLYVMNTDGGELSRVQTGSFVLWLLEESSSEAVLQAAADYDSLEKAFSADYDTLKSSWIHWLEEKFAE